MNKKYHTNFDVWVEIARDLPDLPTTEENAEPFTTADETIMEPVD